MTHVDGASDERTINNTVRHQYRVLSDGEKAHVMHIKDLGVSLLDAINALGHGREYDIARIRVEEAIMWTVKGMTA